MLIWQREREHSGGAKEIEREGVKREQDSEREVAVSGEAENLVTVFRGGSKALSGRAEASLGEG